MAHNNFDTLEILLKLLDDERNDIYVHIDKSVKEWDASPWKKMLSCARLYFVKRVDVSWSTYSHIYAIKNLLLEATSQYHDYYHMLSGVDLPIKTQDQINSFLMENNKKEFVGFAQTFRREAACQKNYFVKYYRHHNKFIKLSMKWLSKFIIKIQKEIGIDICKSMNFEVKKGHDWFSITHEASKLLLEKEKEFRKYFYKAFCPSEFFVQTILYNSEFKNNIYDMKNENNGAQRYIDWKRGSPYVFRKDDFKALKSSEYLFARKFMETKDKNIIDSLYSYLK